MNKRNRIVKTASVAGIIIIPLLMPMLLSGNKYWISILVLLAINILLVSSLRTITLLNHISLGHVGFTLIGAYGSAILVMKAGFPFWAALVMAGLMSAFVALALGYPFLKVKGIYFAILTLLTAETFRLVAYYWKGMTGGTIGLLGIPAPSPMTIPVIGTINFNNINNYYYIVIIVVIICLVILYLIEHSHVSFNWRAIRDAEELSRSVGINVIWYKIINFAIACFFAGIAGSLFAHYQHNLSADFTSRFGVFTSIYLLVYLIAGGQRSFAGPVIGTTVLTLISELARPMREYQPMIIGGIAILVMLFMPGGLAGLPSQFRYWLWKIKRLRQARLMKQNKEAPNSSPTST
jgi:branched-chain amino acid transport system permease protein